MKTMKILLANKFYYHRGGDSIYMLNQEKQQKAHGNKVAVFVMGYLKNLNTPWKKFFPKNMSKLMAFTRLVGDVEDLKDKIEKMFAHDFDYQAIEKDAIERYSSEAYYHKLMEYYK